mmetsp:Transcript_21427/g.45303  ORF Transcript_21427/g.45303 Transcript_21427/m.45303 type:complete len:214 (+) Transcript_21427:513-1154(+)
MEDSCGGVNSPMRTFWVNFCRNKRRNTKKNWTRSNSNWERSKDRSSSSSSSFRMMEEDSCGEVSSPMRMFCPNFWAKSSENQWVVAKILGASVMTNWGKRTRLFHKGNNKSSSCRREMAKTPRNRTSRASWSSNNGWNRCSNRGSKSLSCRCSSCNNGRRTGVMFPNNFFLRRRTRRGGRHYTMTIRWHSSNRNCSNHLLREKLNCLLSSNRQ